MSNTLQSTVQGLVPGHLVTLWKFDFTTCWAYDEAQGPAGCLATHTSRNGQAVVFDGDTYPYIDIEGDAFLSEMDGKFPEPTLTMSSQFIAFRLGMRNHDVRATKVTRIRIFDHLINQPAQAMVDNWFIDRIESINSREIIVKLCVSPGIERLNGSSTQQLSPSRCALSAKYRTPTETPNTFSYTPTSDGGCPFGNPAEEANYPGWETVKYWDNLDNLTGDYRQDRCSGTITGCIRRFNPALFDGGEVRPLPFTGTLRENTSKTGDPC